MINLRLLAACLLFACATPARAEIWFNIEEPVQDATRSGIGLVSGWAVSDLGIESIELFMDGESVGFVPYGSGRGDVAAAFPDIADAEFSGWGMKWAYSLTGEGEHSMSVVVTENGGGTASRELTFNVIRFTSEFIRDPADVVTAGAYIESPVDGRLVVEGAQIEGETVDIELVWDTGSQQFLIDRLTYEGQVKDAQAPAADAGTGFTVETGDSVTVSGTGSDPDGYVVSHSWSQVSGPTVSLQNPEQWTASFTAPNTAGDVRLRLQVTDDDGLTSSDDVIIEVVEPNLKPNAWAGNDLTVETGQEVSITGTASDSDGVIVAYSWSNIGGDSVSLQGADSQTVRFNAPETAGYTRLRFRVTDDDGATDYDDMIVYFEAPTPTNQAPTADAGSNFNVETGDSVSITGNGSDPDGSIVDWSWTQVSGTTVSLSGANGRTVGFTAPESAATIRLRLTVTDDDGATDSDDVTITVKEPIGSGTTTGSTLFSMLDEINTARGTGRNCGETYYPAQPALAWSESLADIAMQHSMDMAYQGYFSHTSADGTSMGDRVFPYWDGTRVGENIATSSIDRSDQYVVDLWIDSPGHCALLMSDDFTHAGVGRGHDPENGYTDPDSGYTFYYFWTLDFGG